MSVESELESDNDEGLYEALSILDERTIKGRVECLIQWAGTDPQTGEPYEPTWEAKEGCSAGLIHEWEEKKKQNPSIKGKYWRELRKRLQKQEEERKKERERERGSAEKRQGIKGKGKRRRDSDSSYVENSKVQKSTANSPSQRRSVRAVADQSPFQSLGFSLRSPLCRDHDSVSPRISSLSATTSNSWRGEVMADGYDESDGCETLEVKQNSSVMSSKPSKKLGPVPQPSSNLFRTNAVVATSSKQVAINHSSAGTHPSQLEPISQFSSPIRDPAARSGDSRARENVSNEQEEDEDKKTTALDVKQPMLVKKIIDGVEVIMVVSDSEDEEDDERKGEEEGDETQARSVARMQEGKAEKKGIKGSKDEEDVDVDKGQFPLLVEDTADPIVSEEKRDEHGLKCLWSTCGKVFEDEVELAKHIRWHAAEFAQESQPSVPVLLSTTSEQVVEAVATATESTTLPAVTNEALTSIAKPATALAESEDNPISAETRITTLEAEIQEKEKTIADLERKLRSAKRDIDFIRAEYQRASDRALEEVNKANDLEKKMKILKSQLDLGLKQRDLHNSAINAKREEEMKKLRLQVEFLIKQSRLTDDKARSKIQKNRELIENVERLEVALYESRTLEAEQRKRAERLKERNTELNEQLSLLRGAQMGAFGESDEDDDGGTEHDDDDDDDKGEEDFGYHNRAIKTDGNVEVDVTTGLEEEDHDDALAAAMSFDLTRGSNSADPQQQQLNVDVDVFQSSSIAAIQPHFDAHQASNKVENVNDVDQNGESISVENQSNTTAAAPTVAVVMKVGDCESWEDGGSIEALRCKWAAESVGDSCKRIFMSVEELNEHVRTHLHEVKPDLTNDHHDNQ